jgi:hypothetical protein
MAIRVREKHRVFTDEDWEREHLFQEGLESYKEFAEFSMAYYDSLPKESRDRIKEHG